MTTAKTTAKTANQPAESAAPAQAPEAQPVPVDQWHGMGGEYVIEDGVRRRVGGPPLPGDEATAGQA